MQPHQMLQPSPGAASSAGKGTKLCCASCHQVLNPIQEEVLPGKNSFNLHSLISVNENETCTSSAWHRPLVLDVVNYFPTNSSANTPQPGLPYGSSAIQAQGCPCCPAALSPLMSPKVRLALPSTIFYSFILKRWTTSNISHCCWKP